MERTKCTNAAGTSSIDSASSFPAQTASNGRSSTRNRGYASVECTSCTKAAGGTQAMSTRRNTRTHQSTLLAKKRAPGQAALRGVHEVHHAASTCSIDSATSFPPQTASDGRSSTRNRGYARPTLGYLTADPAARYCAPRPDEPERRFVPRSFEPTNNEPTPQTRPPQGDSICIANLRSTSWPGNGKPGGVARWGGVARCLCHHVSPAGCMQQGVCRMYAAAVCMQQQCAAAATTSMCMQQQCGG